MNNDLFLTIGAFSFLTIMSLAIYYIPYFIINFFFYVAERISRRLNMSKSELRDRRKKIKDETILCIFLNQKKMSKEEYERRLNEALRMRE